MLDQFFSDLADGRLPVEQGAEAFVATLADQTSELVSVHLDVDYFTALPRPTSAS